MFLLTQFISSPPLTNPICSCALCTARASSDFLLYPPTTSSYQSASSHLFRFHSSVEFGLNIIHDYIIIITVIKNSSLSTHPPTQPPWMHCARIHKRKYTPTGFFCPYNNLIFGCIALHIITLLHERSYNENENEKTRFPWKICVFLVCMFAFPLLLNFVWTQ